jgi:hypothetical protein
MANDRRLILQLAATTTIAAMLSTAAPAVAADGPVTVRENAASANTQPSVIKHHGWRAKRIAASHHDRRVGVVRSELGCAGVWCGRQFVLMIGVGY